VPPPTPAGNRPPRGKSKNLFTPRSNLLTWLSKLCENCRCDGCQRTRESDKRALDLPFFDVVFRLTPLQAQIG
jgi:hypothetical protein